MVNVKNLLFYLVCVCTRTSACVYSLMYRYNCVSICVCVCVYSEDILGVVPHVLHTLCFETVLHCSGTYRVLEQQADWLVYAC